MKKSVSENPASVRPDNALPPEQRKNVTKIEYVCLCLARIGGMFGTTLTGTLAAAFLHELYFGPVGVSSDRIAQILAVQTTLTTVTGAVVGFIAGIIVQKWKTRWGRYRQWYLICLLPIFGLTALYFYVPQGWTVEQMTMLRYGIAISQTIFNTFNNFGQNIAQVISPNPKEKKLVATIWQLCYYVGYGGAYISMFVYGLFSDDKNAMYMTLALVAAFVTAFGNLMCALFCKERIELPKKAKVGISKGLFALFKYKNYRAYHYMSWVNILANVGRFTTYLVSITVGTSKNILLTIPTALGVVVGNVISTALSKKHEPTKLLKFCGPFSMMSASVLFAICFIEAKNGLYFFKGWNSAFFYFFYFIFGVGIGIQELATSHFTVEFLDYLEWQTGERMEAIQGVVPGFVQYVMNYLRDLAIPFILTWVGYMSSAEGDLVKTMQAQPHYMRTCLWIIGLIVFGYALATLLRAIILKTMYNVEGETKKQMYSDLERIRAERRAENEALE